jgi:hypothetical protein
MTASVTDKDLARIQPGAIHGPGFAQAVGHHAGGERPVVASDVGNGTPLLRAPIGKMGSPEMIRSLRVCTDQESPDFGGVKFAADSDPSISEDFLGGVNAIVTFLGHPWTVRRVRYARETRALPIRVKRGIGLFAFKTELLAALRAPDSLPQPSGAGMAR